MEEVAWHNHKHEYKHNLCASVMEVAHDNRIPVIS